MLSISWARDGMSERGGKRTRQNGARVSRSMAGKSSVRCFLVCITKLIRAVSLSLALFPSRLFGRNNATNPDQHHAICVTCTKHSIYTNCERFWLDYHLVCCCLHTKADLILLLLLLPLLLHTTSGGKKCEKAEIICTFEMGCRPATDEQKLFFHGIDVNETVIIHLIVMWRTKVLRPIWSSFI